jgi:hypothetical protein
MTTTKSTSAVLGWFPTTPATEREVIDMANSRQIALRTRLRHYYWLTDCRPLGRLTVDMVRRKMALIDPRDDLSEPELAELLSMHYGFAVRPDDHGEVVGWSIPELDDTRAAAVASITATRERTSRAGKASAARRSDAAVAPAAVGSAASSGDDEF